MSSDNLPKDFTRGPEVLPISQYGVSTLTEFTTNQKKTQHIEWLKSIGLSDEEINLYQANEAGLLEQNQKVQAEVLKDRLKDIYEKIMRQNCYSSSSSEEEPSTSSCTNKFSQKMYPEGHPMNNIKTMDKDLFSHLKDDFISITKRRKMLRRLERRKQRVLGGGVFVPKPDVQVQHLSEPSRPGSLWDLKTVPTKQEQRTDKIGPKNKTMYTIKSNKIVRLEPVNDNRVEFQAVDIVLPVNEAEERLLEGTKMCLDDIKKIERFKDYEPGVPSKVLYLKNISPIVTNEELSLLFNQFIISNGGPIDVRLMTGRMREQAFVSFQNVDVAISALEEVNGTILKGKPIIAQFGRNSNRVQEE